MAAYRVPDRWMTQAGAHLRPGIQIEDTGGSRIVLPGFSPLALGTVTGDRFRRQDDGPRAPAAADNGASAWRSRMTLSAAEE